VIGDPRMVMIRPYGRGDDDALYDICLRTGADGDDATDLVSDPRLLGSVYVGPYLALAPGLAFVLADGEHVLGYVLGALDTVEFEAACRRSWWPALRAQHPLAPPPSGAVDAELVAHIHAPPTTPRAITSIYPSHLHIDLLPAAQGAGWGRALIETLRSALAAAGSPGVHLGVSPANTRAIGFYRRLGFVVVAADPSGATMGAPIS